MTRGLLTGAIILLSLALSPLIGWLILLSIFLFSLIAGSVVAARELRQIFVLKLWNQLKWNSQTKIFVKSLKISGEEV